MRPGVLNRRSGVAVTNNSAPTKRTGVDVIISKLEALGVPVVVVDVDNESKFVYADANQLALVYYRVRRANALRIVGSNATLRSTEDA